MKTKPSWILAFTALLLFAEWTMSAWGSEQKEEIAKPAAVINQQQATTVPIKIMGTIIASKNEKGKITNYCLQEDNGQSIVLSQHGSGMELRRMVGKKIEAIGTLYDYKGEKTIIVNEFKNLSN